MNTRPLRSGKRWDLMNEIDRDKAVIDLVHRFSTQNPDVKFRLDGGSSGFAFVLDYDFTVKLDADRQAKARTAMNKLFENIASLDVQVVLQMGKA